MRMLLLAVAAMVAALSLSACGSDDNKTVVVPPGSTAVIQDGHAKVCPTGQTC